MPEETEIDTDSLREKIDEQREKRGGSFLRWISLTTALLAASPTPAQRGAVWDFS
jgi:hypothetical protein